MIMRNGDLFQRQTHYLNKVVMNILVNIKNRVSAMSRNQKAEHFYSHYKNGMSVLDAGVSSEVHALLPSSNHFLKTFRYASKYYTGLGIEDMSQMDQIYPDKRFVQYSGGRFPFRDKEFDWVFSNAVIEHVGNENDQLMFLREMLRVGKSVFFTTPNKYFPVETHTNVLFLHWNTRTFQLWCKKRHPWVSKYDPYLFSYLRLKTILDRSQALYTIYRNRFCGLVLTFTAVCSEA